MWLPRIAKQFFLSTRKEIHMTTNKPVELGRVSEETKEPGPGLSYGPTSPSGPFTG